VCNRKFLLKKKQKLGLENKDSTKALVPCWRSFGYITVKNEKNRFERISCFISCFKCYHTFRYGYTNGTKHLLNMQVDAFD
jgi:hypothetical protein